MTVSPTFGWTLFVVFLTPRSAESGVSVAVPVLLPGLGSNSSAAVTVATLVCDEGTVLTAGASTRAVIRSVLAAATPTSTVPTVQTPVPVLNVPWLGTAERSCRPATGKESVISTLLAESGPRFETVTVNVIVSPTFGVGSLTVLATARSASRVEMVDSPRSFVWSGSNWSVVATAATFVNEPGPGTATTIASVFSPPAGIAPTCQTPVAGE